ncbi:MAG: hypothetical protein ACK50B_14275, partial [Betaproteobacteria bacterium]
HRPTGQRRQAALRRRGGGRGARPAATPAAGRGQLVTGVPIVAIVATFATIATGYAGAAGQGCGCR